MDDAPRAEAAVRELAKHKAADTIRKYFKTLPDRMWQIAGSKKLEKAFLATLNPEQRATYDRAIENRKKMSAKFDEFFGGKKLDEFYAKDSPVQEYNEQEPRDAGGEVPIKRIVVGKSKKPADVLVWVPMAGAHDVAGVNCEDSAFMTAVTVGNLDDQYSHYILRGKPDGIELANLPDGPDENAEFHYHGIYVDKKTADKLIHNAAEVSGISGYTKTLRFFPEGLVQYVFSSSLRHCLKSRFGIGAAPGLSKLRPVSTPSTARYSAVMEERRSVLVRPGCRNCIAAHRRTRQRHNRLKGTVQIRNIGYCELRL